MKKALFFASLLAAALSFVGCNKEAEFFGRNGRKMQIVLTDVDTRTVNDGLATKWVDGDALNVFYAPAGTTDYSDNAKFTVDDVDANHATGTATLTAEAYDWYLLYPYDSHVKTPANTSAGYLTLGCAASKTQSQAGLNSMAHLAGKDMPVYGVAKNVASTTTPEVTMKQVASVVAVNVTNATDKAITVSSVSFTAPEDIVGTYYIDFSGDELGFTGSGSSYVSKTATLDVTGDETIAAGASAKFYIAIKPFAAKTNDVLAIKVHAGGQVFGKELTLPGAVEFKSGRIKQLNISYTGGAEIPASTLEEIAAMENDTDVQTAEVLVVAKYARGVMLAQNGFYLLAFDGGGVNAAIGDIVTVTGKVGEYGGFKQITNPVVKVVSSGNEVTLPEPKVLEGIDEYESDKIELIQYSGTLAVSGNYYNVKVDGCTRQGSIQYPIDTDALKALDKKLVTATGFFTGISGSSTKYVNMMSTSVVAKDGNVFDVTPSQINVAATATSAEITVTGNVEWTADASAGAAVSPASGTGDGTITVTFPANEDAQNTKEYTVFVRTEAEGVNDEFEVNITQAKADAAGFKTVTVDFSKQGYENAYAMPASTVIDGITFAFDKGTNGNAPKYYTSGTAIRMYGSNSMTVSAGGKTIVSIELTFGSNDGTNDITTDVPTYVEPTWTGEAASVTFTIGGTTGQRRIQAVTVKYKDEAVPVTLQAISISGQQTEFNVDDTFTLGSNAKVMAQYSDGNDKDVTAQATHSNPDMSTAGTKEVTVSYTEGGITKETKYDITVKGGSATHAGTVEDPFTVADAINVTIALGLGKTSTDFYYTKGIISQIDEVSTDYGNATYYISDDGTTDNQFEVYHGKYIGNTSFTAADQIKVGDEVVVNGKLTYHKSPDVPEVAAGNYIYSLTRNGSPVYAMAAVASRTTVSAAASTVKVNVYGNVEWSCAVTNPATVDKGTGSGIGSFTVNIPENTGDARIFVVTVASANAETIAIRIDQEKKSDTGLTTVTVGQDFLAANKDGQMDDVISYTNDSDYGTTVVSELRVYKGKTLTVSATEGHTIKMIKMTCTADGVNKQGPGCWGEGAPDGYTFEEAGKTGTWTGSASSVAFTAKDNQVRIVELIVAYE